MNSPPNCNYEYHNVHVDSMYVENPNDQFGILVPNQFVTFMPREIENIVQVEVNSASLRFSAATSNVAYIVIDELNSQFNSRTGNVVPTQYDGGGFLPENVTSQGGSTSTTRSNPAILAMPIDDSDNKRKFFSSNGNFPAVTQFINPIQRLRRLSVNIYDDSGNTLVTNLLPLVTMDLKFTCLKPNLCTRL